MSINKDTKIKVIDSIMGQGKTTWAINYMKNNPDKRFIYITPYLDEVERVKGSISKAVSPFIDSNKGHNKLNNLRELTKQGKNIVTTHALFSKLDLDIQENIKVGEYILILDEVVSVAQTYDKLTGTDRENFFKYFAYKDTDGFIKWRVKEHPPEDFDKGSKFYDEMILCLNGNLLEITDKLIMWELPVNIFKQFQDVYILTYMFNGSIQKPYFDLYNVQYEYLSVKQGELIPYESTSKETKEKLWSLINLVDSEKMNSIGDSKYSLSATWFKENVQKGSIYTETLRRNGNNFFKRICKGNAKDNMVTTISDSYSLISDKGWASKKTSFVAFNARATNDYAHKKNLAYILNVFPHTSLIMYFNDRSKGKININQEEFALSTLIQWIWRSRIRRQDLPDTDRQINLYIPSYRMRSILLDWLGVPSE